MSQLDLYRNIVTRKQEELSKLKQDLAKEEVKISPLRRKIISANSTIKKTKSQSTIKSKLGEIERAEKSIADIEKKIGNIHKKIAQKEKELTTADRNYRNEESRENKKHADAEMKRQREAKLQVQSIEQTIKNHEQLQSQMKRDIEHLKVIPERITVLFMAANPIDTQQLRLDEEARAIQEKIRLSEFRNSVCFQSRWATRASDVLQAINETNPTIVHFSGHGSDMGELILQNPDGSMKFVTKEAISQTLATASDTIRLIVFNACFSHTQAESVSEHIEAAIGMSDSIGDEAARVFAAQLYSSIGFGHSLLISFNQAIAALLLEGIPEDKTPRIYAMEGVELDKMILVLPNKINSPQ